MAEYGFFRLGILSLRPLLSKKIVDKMDKLVTVNAQTELQTNSRMEKILAERRAILAQKESKRA